MSPKDVAAVGGWVDTTTLQKVYQVADEETMEAVISAASAPQQNRLSTMKLYYETAALAGEA